MRYLPFVVSGLPVKSFLAAMVIPLIMSLWPRLTFFVSSPHGSDSYSVHILSYDPVMIYFEGFISKSERDHLLHLGDTLFQPSKIVYDGVFDPSLSNYRTSTTAFLPGNDTIVQQIIHRASQVQGFTPLDKHELLQLTRYEPGQQFRPHYDAIADEDGVYDRITTFFAVLEATCDDCGTQFPLMSVNWTLQDPAWCRFVDCNNHEALTFRAIPGNAVFWKNTLNIHEYDDRTLHAGLPPEKGVKTGLNIWTME